MAQKKVPLLHLEAMEEAENKGCQSAKAGHPKGQGLPVGKLPAGLLARCR